MTHILCQTIIVQSPLLGKINVAARKIYGHTDKAVNTCLKTILGLDDT